MCLDVARDAMQMHSAGASIAAIRDAIDAKYKASFGSMTPTPPVKRK